MSAGLDPGEPPGNRRYALDRRHSEPGADGLVPLRLHDLRHTCASLAIAAGADVKVLQRMMGHASDALTLDRYGHLMPGQAQSVADRLDETARRARPTEDAPVTPLRRAAHGGPGVLSA